MSASSYHDEKCLVGYLLRQLEERLAGRHEHEILRTQPSDHCQLGVLAPWSTDVESEEQPDEFLIDADDEPSTQSQVARSTNSSRNAPTATTEADTDPDTSPPPVEPFSVREEAGRRPPSATGLAIALTSRDNAIQITVGTQCVIYSRHFPNYDDQRAELGNRDPDQIVPGERPHVSLVEKFKRHTLALPPVVFTLAPDNAVTVHDNGAIQAALDNFVSQLRLDPTVFRKFSGNRTVPVASLRDQITFQQFLGTLRGNPEIPAWRASVRVRTRPTDHGLRIEVHLCNDSRRDLDHPSNDQFSSFYDTEVTLKIDRGELAPIELLPVPTDYQYDRNVYALGRNAGAEIAEDRATVRSRALACYEQARITTQDRVVAPYLDLATDPFPTLTRIHQAMIDYAADWQQRIIEKNALLLDSASLNACQNDLRTFENEIAGFAAGVAVLHADPRLTVAFQSMNRSFTRGKHKAWRLFQIVFIVTQLPSLTVRESITSAEWPKGIKHEWGNIIDRADVLWFPTGGGKTEAYLGLVGCAALYDRLRGKHHGVTAWLRFPLRMLSVQQLQRAVRMVWETEQERLELEKHHGSLGDPFSLGYFVGSANTPNMFFGPWSFDRLEADERLRERLLLVPDCPACKKEGSVFIQLDRANQRVRHVCSHCAIELPVYVSDDEIYRFQPTMLVGTVDKIAAIGYQSKVAALWTGPQWRCPCADHGFGNGDWCIKDCPTNNSKTRGSAKICRLPVKNHDPSPSLHIQDELHLLQEELGAFAGHYETMVRANEAAISGKPAKVIAATATIAGYVHQVRQIYGVRNVNRFPNRGYDLSQTFYSILERESAVPNAPPKTARVFAAFRPPFLRPADAAARCTEILHASINELQNAPTTARELIGLRDAKTDDEIRALLAFYSRTLTYVGKRDSGIRIRQRLEQDSARVDSGLRPGGLRDLNVDYLSAHSTLKEIAATVKKAEAATPWSSPDHLDATVATHVISHGVDVEYFNLMTLERIPEQVADYIQVASRSGRQHVGLVLSVLPRHSLRAGSIYDRFVEFHRHLDRMVTPVPVNRFAKAASRRSFPGILLGTLYGRHLTVLPGEKSQRLHFVARAIAGNSAQITRDGLYRALLASYALDEGRFDKSLETQMTKALELDWERFRLEVQQVSHHELADVFSPKPMSSLRDVDVPVPFRPDDTKMNYQDLHWFQQP